MTSIESLSFWVPTLAAAMILLYLVFVVVVPKIVKDDWKARKVFGDKSKNFGEILYRFWWFQIRSITGGRSPQTGWWTLRRCVSCGEFDGGSFGMVKGDICAGCDR